MFVEISKSSQMLSVVHDRQCEHYALDIRFVLKQSQYLVVATTILVILTSRWQEAFSSCIDSIDVSHFSLSFHVAILAKISDSVKYLASHFPACHCHLGVKRMKS